MFNHLTLTWDKFKYAIDNQHMQWGYLEESHRYILFGQEGSLLFYTTILKDSGPDHVDFETNYKANVPSTLTTVVSGVNLSDDIQILTFNGNKLMVESSPATGAIQNIRIVDKDIPTQIAKVDPSGRLQVATPTPTPPPTTDPISQSADGNLSNNATSNIFYTITNSKTLVIQRFLASGEGGAQDGWFFELYYDPNGVGSANSSVQGSWVLISFIVIQENGSSDFFDTPPDEYIGDGTGRIVLRRVRRGGGGAKRGFIQFTGYEA